MIRRLKFLPNFLTILRLALCPAILVLIHKAKLPAAMIVFAVACLTDFLDGFFARRLNARTPLGEILDPISDKVFTLAFFSLLMTLGSCPPWFLGLLISTTLLQGAGLLLVKVTRGDAAFSHGPIALGKWNTALQFSWIGLSLVDTLIVHRAVEPSLFVQSLNQLGYMGLATLQICVFFRYFYLYQRELAPHFRFFARAA